MLRILTQKRFYGGIAESEKEGLTGACRFTRNLNIIDEPAAITLLPKTVKSSGSTVVDLIKWIVSGIPHDTNNYFYGDTGHIYSRSAAGAWSDLRTVANSGGQGLEIHNDYLYYTQDSQIGRYGALSGAPAFTDNWQTGLNNTSTTNLAPIKAFKEGFAVGNGNDLGWWDGSTWTQNKLVLPIGFNIRTLEVLDEFLVIGAWRGTSITDTEDGYLFFWDGDATTYNFFVKVNEGGANALLNTKNRLLSIVGSAGVMNLNYAPFNHVHTIPLLEISKYLDIFPGAVGNWKGKALIGVAGNHNSVNVRQGVYMWANRSDKYPESLSLAFTISTGSFDGDVKIGAVKGLGDELYIGWQDDTTYGVDRVVDSNDPFASGTFEGLLFDNQNPLNEKLALKLKASHLPLVSGESVQLGYKTDRDAAYTTGTANSTVGETETLLPIDADEARCKDLQYEVILATTGSTSPTVTGIGALYDDLSEEEDF